MVRLLCTHHKLRIDSFFTADQNLYTNQYVRPIHAKNTDEFRKREVPAFHSFSVPCRLSTLHSTPAKFQINWENVYNYFQTPEVIMEAISVSLAIVSEGRLDC